MIPTNPDLAATDAVIEVLKTLTVEYPDGEREDFQYLQVDAGYVSTPTRYPYVSVHTGDARIVPARLGRGDQMVAHDVDVDCVVSIEYEDAHSAERGYRRMTQIRWDALRHLLQHRETLRDRGISFVNFEETALNYLTPDDGGYQEWGFTGVVMLPLTVKFRGV